MPENTSPMTVLGFDFGQKRIGVAVGQTASNSAKSLRLLKARNGIPNWSELDNIVREWEPRHLVVGFPLNMDGTEQAITNHVKAFSQALNSRYHLPISFQDERLTTKEARARIFEEAGAKGLATLNVDAVAAKIILQTWLDNYNDKT